MRRSSEHDHVFRYIIISVVFCVVCVFYLGRLFYIQISGRENAYDTGTTTKTVAVQAVRGEIFDRNGKKLVSNRYTYDLTISHAEFSSLTVYRSNQACLQLVEALTSCGETGARVEKYFPFEGTYPYYYLSEEAAAGDSVSYYRMKRIIGDLRLEEDTTPEELVQYYTDQYQLLATDITGKRLFTDDQIDRIFRMRYDMDALRFSENNDYTVAADLSASSQLIPYVSELGLRGVSFTVDVTRVYEYPGIATHILGTIGPIYSEEWEYYNSQGYQMNAIVGKSGCELAFESYLRGVDGTTEIEVDSTGRVIKETVKTAPTAGKNIYLTIDIDLQIAAEKGLDENVKYVAAQVENGKPCNAGAAVAIDPDTFEILAIASNPTYDIATYNQNYNELLANEAKPLINRALSGLYEPGSTFKLGISVAALMEGVIDPAYTVDCNGEYPYGSAWAVSCSTYGPNSHMGATNLKTAIAQSCNSFFCKMGDLLGIYKIEDYMGRFGFGRTTGIELGDSKGILAGPTYRQEANVGDVWYEYGDGKTWHASIGQSDHQATPLQLACYAATLANGGTRYSAHLLHSVYTFGSSTPIYTYTQTEETVLDRIDIPTDVQAAVFAGMRAVVTENTSIWNLMANVPVEVGGKTGTAQNSTGVDHALFVGTAPYTDPEIVVSVVLEYGVAGTYASRTAAAILDAYYQTDSE